MRQKRQTYQKDIRRKAIDNIFRKNRQKYFNYNFKPSSNSNHLIKQTADIQNQCNLQFARYSEQLQQSIREQNIENLLSSVQDSYYELKRMLIKFRENGSVIKKVIQSWFKHGMDQLLIAVVKMFETINRNNFCAIRKQIFKLSISHFHLIFQYYSLIHTTANTNNRQLFNFLFLALTELSNLPESIMEIMTIVSSLIHTSQLAMHEFLFQNQKEGYAKQGEGSQMQQHNENKKQKLISFENICYVMFQNKDKFASPNSPQQQMNYREIKMIFIELFKQYAYELQSMKSYIEDCRKAATTKSIARVDEIYEKTLKLYSYPSAIVLKQFLEKPVLAIIWEIIKEMKQHYLDHWAEQPDNQQNLAISLEALRLLIEFYPSYKLINELQNYLGKLLDLIIVRNLNIQVKFQTLLLLDIIIFLDQNSIITDRLILNYSLFEKIWSYDEPSAFHVKINIVNNLLLCTAGFHAVNKHLSPIVVSLYETKNFISLALTFIQNYFIFTEFALGPSSRVNLVTGLLYSLPGEHFSLEDLQKDCYILSHLYNNNFSQPLPDRYKSQRQQYRKADSEQTNQVQDHQKKLKLIDHMLDLYKHYYQQTNQQTGFMEYQ